jgi:curved DNA-binding protein CbpA
MNTSTQKDYYRILGVIDSAETAVIKAAYKALMQIYHPDKYQGAKKEALQRSKEINEAYTVLIDLDKRIIYDAERSARKNQYEAEPDLDQKEKDFTSAKNDTSEIEWNIALEHVKGLNDLYQGLYSLSHDLAFTFKLDLLETKRFKSAITIARQFELEFLEKFFGKNIHIQEFSHWLLTHGKRDVAKEVNKIVIVLGNDIIPNDVIDSLVKKHKLIDYKKFSSEDNLNVKAATKETKQQHYQKDSNSREYTHHQKSKLNFWNLILNIWNRLSGESRDNYPLIREVIWSIVLFLIIIGLFNGLEYIKK